MGPGLSPGRSITRVILSREFPSDPRYNGSSVVSNASYPEFLCIGVKVSRPVPERIIVISGVASCPERYNGRGLHVKSVV